MYTGTLLVKDPQATGWPKGIDWTAYLAEIGVAETIAVSTWVITGSDALLTIDGGSASIVVGSLKTQLKVSGGTVGAVYTVTNHITTSSGGTDDRSLTILIQHQ